MRFLDKQLIDYDLREVDNDCKSKLLHKKISEKTKSRNAMETILDATKSEESLLLRAQSGYSFTNGMLEISIVLVWLNMTANFKNQYDC